jgi:3D (Asp-Asp-Asp) domain-containing protein
MRKSAVLVLGLWWCCTAAATVHRGVPKAMLMRATAFTRAQRITASGTWPHRGTAAADPKVFPPGTRIRITGAGAYNGNYLVTDTGGGIRGRRIDIYVSTPAEARRFGTRTVRVQILRLGQGKEDARDQDVRTRAAPGSR